MSILSGLGGGGGGVGTGFVAIKPDTSGFGDDLEAGLDKEGAPAAERSGGKSSRVFKAAFASGIALLGKSFLDFSAFEKSMNEVFTLIPGISKDAEDKMTQQAKDFSVQFGMPIEDVVHGIYQSLSAGVSQDNLFSSMSAAAKLAKGGVTDMTTSIDGLSSVVNAYGPSVINMQQASDDMFTTVKLGKTTIDELGKSIFNVTPTAAGLGVGFDQVSAALAAMTLQGVPTSVATTQLRQMLVELSKSGSKTAETFTKLSGKTFAEFIAGGGNLEGALSIIKGAADKSGKSISDMFGSVEAGSAALVLAGAGAQTFHDDLGKMGTAAGATDEAFKTMNSGMGATMDRLKAKMKVTMLNIGEAIAPTIGKIGDALGIFLDFFSKIPGPMQAVLVVVLTLTAGLFAFARPIMAGISLFSKLGGVFSALAANPWILVLAGLVLVTVLIIKNWTKVKEVLTRIWAGLKLEARAVATFFVGIFKEAGAALQTVFHGYVELIKLEFRAIGTAATAVWDGITAGWSAVTSGIASAAGAVRDAVVAAWDAIGSAISATLSAIGSAATTAWDGITTAAGAVRDAVVGVFSAIGSAASAVWNGITSAVSATVGTIVAVVTGIPNAIASAFTTLADIIAAPFRAAFQGIKAAWNSTVGGFGFTTPSWIPLLGGNKFTIPSMSAGGVLTSPTLALAGEYAGAARNPEIVTPQNIMRETIVDAMRTASPAGGGLTVNGPLIANAVIRKDQDIVDLSRELAREVDRRNRAAGNRNGVNA